MSDYYKLETKMLKQSIVAFGQINKDKMLSSRERAEKAIIERIERNKQLKAESTK